MTMDMDILPLRRRRNNLWHKIVIVAARHEGGTEFGGHGFGGGGDTI